MNFIQPTEFLNLPNPSGRTRPGVYSASNRNEYQGSKVQLVRKADNLTAIYEPTV
jgi:hypothetical protein